MIRVTNGVLTLRVSRAAFKSFFQGRGFHIVNSDKEHEDDYRVNTHTPLETAHSHHFSQQRTKEKDEDDEDEETEEDVDLSEIPIGEMSFEQLNAYADQLKINHEGIRSKKELRALIRESLKN